ncbi:MAG: hypothetical protein SGILL_001320 [Bacillariaceae sp.]
MDRELHLKDDCLLQSSKLSVNKGPDPGVTNALAVNPTNRLLTLEELSKIASNTNSSESMKQISELVYDGQDFAHGLILSDILGVRENFGEQPMEEFRSQHDLEPYDSVVIAVHEHASSSTPNILPCMRKLLQSTGFVTNTSPNLECHVLFLSEANAKEWRDDLLSLGCKAQTIPSNGKRIGNLTPQLNNFLDKLDVFASLAYDGYILPSNVSSSEPNMYLDMIHYARSTLARRQRRLPIDMLPHCFWDEKQ